MKRVIEIEGGGKLNGEVRISGAKNAILPILAASILAHDSVVTIDDVPDIDDVYVMVDILERLKLNIIVGRQGPVKQLAIDTRKIKAVEMVFDSMSKIRASYYFMGSMIARFKRLKIVLPGGCYLGPRPIDLHVKGFERMGARVKSQITPDGEFFEFEARGGLTGAKIFLDIPSVGATINLMMAATGAKGETIIENAAKEPEVIDVATFLNNMGAKISGVGTDIIKIEGDVNLEGCYHQVIPDRIEAGTYIMIAAGIGEEVVVRNVIPEHLEALISKLRDMGSKIVIGTDFVKVSRAKKLIAVDVKTGGYPSFATDHQQVIAALLTWSKGRSKVIDTIYIDRFRNIEEFKELGALAKVGNGEASIEGVEKLTGGVVKATDLRAGASLVLMGLISDGKTIIHDIEHIERGYEHLEKKLQNLGGKIKIVEVEE